MAHGLIQEEMSEGFKISKRMTFEQFLSVPERKDGKSAGAVRVSLGAVTNFEDVYRTLRSRTKPWEGPVGRARSALAGVGDECYRLFVPRPDGPAVAAGG